MKKMRISWLTKLRLTVAAIQAIGLAALNQTPNLPHAQSTKAPQQPTTIQRTMRNLTNTATPSAPYTTKETMKTWLLLDEVEEIENEINKQLSSNQE